MLARTRGVAAGLAVSVKASRKLLAEEAVGKARIQSKNVGGERMRSVKIPRVVSVKKVGRGSGKTVAVRDDMTIAELARRMGKSTDMLLKVAARHGHDAVVPSDRVSSQVASKLVTHFRMLPTVTVSSNLEWHSRSPVVTVMGHVDHGKTTLLDRLRQTSVAAQEPGGITQHIGAFRVQLDDGSEVTFVDTPGHALFASLRQRGANVTDVVVLVVAADDGVKDQTVQSIRYAQHAGVPILVAINKCDKANADVRKTMEQLLQCGIQLEEMGGDVQVVNISALKGTNVKELVEAVLAEAELLNLRAHVNGPAEAVILESFLDLHRGPVATVLVQQGVISVGSLLVASSTWARVRQMSDDVGKDVERAFPSMPIRISGWRALPTAGDLVFAMKTEEEARELADLHKKSTRHTHIISEELQESSSRAEKPILPLIIKADTLGSLEALVQSLKTYSHEEVMLKVALTGLGSISDSDIEMAASAEGIVVGFNVKLPRSVNGSVKKWKVTVITHNVIYRLLMLIKDQLNIRVPLSFQEVITGEATILQVFQLRGKSNSTVAGCRVKTGSLINSKRHRFRILRGKSVIHEGALSSLKRVKEDVHEAKKETECGITFRNDPEFREGDTVQCYSSEKVQNTVSWNIDL